MTFGASFPRAVVCALLLCFASAGSVPAGVIQGSAVLPDAFFDIEFEASPPPFDPPELAEDAPSWVREAHELAWEFGLGIGWTQMGIAFETGAAVERSGDKAEASYLHALANHETEYAPLLLSRLHGLGELVDFSPARADHYARIAAMRSGERFLDEAADSAFWPSLPLTWVPRKRLRAALEWVKERESWSHAERFALSLAYEHGDGVPQDYEMALYWLVRASGHHRKPKIQFYYGRCLLIGYCADISHLGNSRVLFAKSRLHTAAALNKYSDAQLLLGLEYLSGENLPMDRAKGYTWLYYASQQGVEVLKDLDALYDQLTPDQRDEVHRWLETRSNPPVMR